MSEQAKIERVKQDPNRPKGVAFYSVKSGETRYAISGAQIQAYLNSSDMGINASHGQNFGWRLAADWVEKVKEFRRDEAKMERLSTKFGGRKVTVPQVLAAIYSSELRAYTQIKQDDENPFEEKYLQDLAKKPAPVSTAVDPATTGEDKTVETVAEVTPTPPEIVEPDPKDAPAAKPATEVISGAGKVEVPKTNSQKSQNRQSPQTPASNK